MLKRVILITISLVLAFSLCAFTPQSASAAATSKLVITNQTGAAVTITFRGQHYYRVVANPGKTKVVIERGSYTTTSNPCGAYNIEGKLSAYKANSTLKLAKCNILKIYNLTRGTLYFTFTGPTTYRISAPLGVSTWKIYKGLYDYKVTGRCDSGSDSAHGTVKLTTRNYYWTWWC